LSDNLTLLQNISLPFPIISDNLIFLLIFSNKKVLLIFILKKYFHICSEIESKT